MSATNFTTSLIESITSSSLPLWANLACIGGEVPFLDGARRADLVVISEQVVSAIEIKSEKDSLAKARGQSLDYAKTFEEVYFAINIKHYPQIKTVVPTSIGIILEEKNKFSLIRKAKTKKRLDKSALISTLFYQELKAILAKKSRGLFSPQDDILALRDYTKKEFTLEEMIKIRHKVFLDRYYLNYQRFVSEVGQKIHSDDLLHLSRKSAAYIK